MIFSYVAPGPALRGLVRDHLIAHFRFDRGRPVPVKPYAPKPEQGITFFVRGRPRMVDPLTGAVRRAPPVSVFGQQVTRCDVHLPGEFLMLRVHFEPGALFRALGVPLCELGGSYFDAEPVLGPEVREVSDRLAAARSYAGMVAIVESYLLRRMSAVRRDAHPVDRVARHLTADPLRASLDWLADQACLSPRQLRRKFTERVGVGPKLYGRLVRFHRAHRLKAAHPTMAWTSVALELGYTDYQHMVRDFRQFANATPTVWLREDGASPENLLEQPGPG